ANEGASSHRSKYAGQQSRAIKSLSAEDIAELKRGGGWGLAKAAELNGVPGPIHLLEMKDKIDLNESQRSAINAIYRRMKSRAILHGERLIDLERRLEGGFRNRTITDALLRDSLSAIAETKKELRYVHLAAHIETLKILTEKQVDTYNTLRGYSKADPCASVPKGHNAEMWRKHNNCD
ncbi:MAG: hypothetical protein J4F48_14960, partial [Nitrospinae bacterium]|nr:hypothetical protein [Nitrospinota bacterium]